jgi:plastocyanin
LLVPLAFAAAVASSTQPSLAGGPTLTISDSAFPPEVVISPGETVIWVNAEAAMPHDVISLGTDLFHSPYLQPGESFSFTFDQAGRYDYFCSLHSWMQATIVVAESAAPDPSTQTNGGE